MKKFFAKLSAVMLCVAMMFLLAACGNKTQDVLKGKWFSDLSEAKEGAKQMNRPILVYFGNSTKNKLETSKEFTQYAGKNLVLAYVDYAKLNQLKGASKEATDQLIRDFGITDDSNISALLDSDGKTLLTVLSGDPSKYELKQIDQAINNARAMTQMSANMPATPSELNALFSFVPETLATIDDITITRKDMIAVFAEQGFPLRILEEIPKDELYKAAQQETQILIETAIMLKLAKKQGIVPSPEIVKAFIDEANKSMTEEDRKNAEEELKEQGLTLDEYAEKLTKDPEVQKAAVIQKLVNEQYLQKIMKDITDQEILKYYEENKADYTIPENITVAHILAGVEAGADDKEYAEAKTKIDAVYEQLKESPEKFAELAREKSDCPSGKSADGKLPAFYRSGELRQGNSMMDKTFTDESFKLEKVGEISKPFKTDFGWHIVKLLEKNDEFVRPLNEDGKQVLRKEIAGKKADQLLTADIEAYKETEGVKITAFPAPSAEQ